MLRSAVDVWRVFCGGFDVLNDATILRAMRRLGVTREDFAVRTAGDLSALQSRVRKAYRRAAFSLHPDVTANDAAKREELIALGMVVEEISALTPPKAPRRKFKMTFRARGGSHVSMVE